MKIALLIVDMQELLLKDQVKPQDKHNACEYINYVADRLRENDQVVVHIKDIEGADHPDDAAYDFIPEIHVEAGDTTVIKVHSNAFWQTELESMLTEKGVELVIVSGFAAEHCVLFTYNGAIERGFNTAMLQGGILSSREDAVQTTYRDRQIISYTVVELFAASLTHPKN